MTCHCGCGKTYYDKGKDGERFEVKFDPASMHCRQCGTLVSRDDTRGGLCIDCLYKKIRKQNHQPGLFGG